MPKNAFFWTFQIPKIAVLLANFIKVKENGYNSAYIYQSIVLLLYKNGNRFLLFFRGIPASLSSVRRVKLYF